MLETNLKIGSYQKINYNPRNLVQVFRVQDYAVATKGPLGQYRMQTQQTMPLSLTDIRQSIN